MKIKIFHFLQHFSYFLPMKFRICFLKLFGMKIGDNSRILPGCYFETPWLIEIGKNCFINQNTKFYNGSHSIIKIEDNVYISYDVKFLGTTHEIGSTNCRAGKIIYKPIKIGAGAWIGGGGTILAGISIGKGCTGALVNKNCEPNSLYVGVPARLVRKL